MTNKLDDDETITRGEYTRDINDLDERVTGVSDRVAAAIRTARDARREINARLAALERLAGVRKRQT